MKLPRSDRISWANGISSGLAKIEVPSDWESVFARRGDEPIVKRLQLQRAYNSYFVPAAATAHNSNWSVSLALLSPLTVMLRRAGRESLPWRNWGLLRERYLRLNANALGKALSIFILSGLAPRRVTSKVHARFGFG